MRRVKEWFRPSDELAASERLATVVRWALLAFILLVNILFARYSVDIKARVNLLAAGLGAGNLVWTVLVWIWPRVRPFRALSLCLQFLDIAFIAALVWMTPVQYYPYEVLFFLVILMAALRFGMAVSVLSSLVVSGAYILLALIGPQSTYFSAGLGDPKLLLRLFAFVAVGGVGGLMAQMERTQRRRREEERRRSRELEVVQRIGSAISTALEMDRLVEQVFTSLREIVPFAEGEITLWSGEEGCLTSRSLYTPDGLRSREARYAPGEGYSGWMAVHRRPLWIPDVAAEKVIRPKGEVGFASHLGVPLLLGDRLVGTLELSSERTNAFKPDDRDLLMAVAPQIAAMLDHARLYDRVRQNLERRVHQLSAIEQIDQELSGTLDLHKVIQAVLDRAIEFTGADAGALLGMTERGDGLLILAHRGYREDMERYTREPWPLEAGIVGHVARSLEPILVEDITQDADYVEATGKTGSELAVPIRREDEILGVLNLESARLAAFDEQDLEFSIHLAEHAAIAIQNARLFAQEQRRARELAALHDISVEISRQTEVGDILKSVVARAVQLLDATSGGLYTYDAPSGELGLAVIYNMPAQYQGTRLKLGQGLAGQVAESRQPLMVDDYRTFAGRANQYATADFRAVIAVPLVYADEMLGVLDVLHAEEGRTFGDRDMRLLLSMANQAAAAIANARLFAEARRWAEQLAALQEVNRTLGRTLGYQATIRALIEGVQRLLPGSEGEVCLYDAERKIFQTEATLGEVARVASAETYSLDEGYTGWIGRHRQPLLIGDCAAFQEVRPRREEMVLSGQMRSYLGVPMLIGDRLIGTLELIGSQANAFRQEHLRLLSLVAGQAAVAIDNARLYELTERRLRQRIDQLLALQKVGQALNTTLLLDDNLQTILEESIRATGATHGNIAMYDEAVGAFRVTGAVQGYSPEEMRLLRQLRLGRGRSMVDDVLRTGHAEIVPDSQADPRPICVRREARSALSVPILYEGRVIGVINVLSTQPRAFDEEHLQFAQTLATQASLAVGNARRYEELVQQREVVSQRATQLREILEIGNSLRADRELPDILSQVAYGVVGSVGYGVVLFSLVAEDDPTVLERVTSAGIPLEDFQRLQQTRPSLQSYQDLFRDEFQISRSYFIPQEAGLASALEQTYLFPGMEQEPQELGAEEWHLRDIVLVPMYSSAGELLGVLSADNPFDRKRPARRTIEALEIFANQAAIAVENARLFRERERRISELNVLNRISQATTSSLDLDSILLSIYERIAQSRVLDVESFYIAILEPDRAQLRFYPVVDRGVLYDPEITPIQGGMAGWIVEHRRPLLIPDLPQAYESGSFEDLILSGGLPTDRTQSYLGVPIIVGDDLIGIISAQSYQKGAYGDRERQFLLTVANQVAVAIQNARLFREREQRLAELAILNEIGQALSSALELGDLVEVVHQQVGRIFSTTNFYIALYDERADEWETFYQIEEGQRLPPQRHKVRAGLTGNIIRRKVPLLFRTAAELDAFQESEGVQRLGRPALSWLGVPLIAADKVVGVMAIQSYERENVYNEQDLALFSTIAAQAAIAIDNARLFQERERRITELAILNEISTALSSALDLDRLLETVHQQVSRVFDTTNFYIATYEADVEEWTLAFQIERGERQPPTRNKLGVGLTSHIIRTRKPILLRNAMENAAVHEELGIPALGEQALSWLGVPLIAADKVVGVMAIQSYERENVYNEQDLALFSTIAAQAAIAIDNARLFQERERRITELAILNDMGRALSSALERGQVMQAIHEQVGRILDTTNFYIALYDEERREWELALDIVNNERRPPSRYSLEQGLTGYIIRTRQPLLFRSSAEIEGFDDLHGIERVGIPASSWVGVPLIAADRVIGVIGVESYERENAYSSDDLAVLSTVAAQAAVSLENSRLFEETRQRLQQVNTLLEVSRDVATRLDLPTLLQSILQAAVQSVQAAERGSILLLDEAAQELVVTAQIGYAQAGDHKIRMGLDEGFAGWVCREGRADIVLDAQSDPRFVVTDSSKAIRSIMSAPLQGRRGLVGVINLDNLSHPAAFTRADLEFLSGLAHQAAVAIENARLFEERERQAKVLEARVRELSALLEGTRAITSTLELQEVLRTLVGVVERQMEVDTVALWLVEGEEIVPAAAAGLPDSFLESKRTKVGEGLSGQVAAEGRVLSVADVTLLARKRLRADVELDRELGLHSFLGVPVTYQQRILGVLSVMSRQVREFTPEEVALLTGLAEQAGIAVENARLFQEREQRINDLTGLNEVGRAISSTVRLDELLEKMSLECGRLVDTSNFIIALYDERTETVSFPVYHEYGQRLELAGRQRGHGLTEFVIQQKAPVVINRDLEAFCEEHGIRYVGTPSKSWLGVPMIYMDHVVGIIALQDYDHYDAYTEHHVRLLSTLANSAAIAVQNARLFSDLETSRTELETRLIQLGALQEVSQAVSGTLEVDAVIATVLDAVTATIGFSYAVISLVDEEANEVRAVQGVGVAPEQIADSHKPLDSSDIMADIVRSGKTEVIDGWDDRFDREMFEKFGHANLVRVYAPLVARGKAIGLIEAGYAKEFRSTITQDDIEVLQTFLTQASIAIDNARLFAEIRRFTEELEKMVEARTQQLQDEKNRLEALHTITTELSSSLDLDEILLKTIDLASMATGRSLGMVLLREPGTNDLVCRAMLDEGNVLRPGHQVVALSAASALREVLEEHQTLRIEDAQHDPRTAGLPPLPSGTRSVAAVPLVSAEEVVGVILLTHSQSGFFDDDQMRLLATLGGEVATAIHNAELYAYINDQALRLSDMLTSQQEEASKVRSILQSIADGVIVVDRANRILMANPAAQQILGMAREELEGRTTAELPGLFLAGGILSQDARRFELLDRYINVHSTPVVMDSGEILGRVYVLRDITREVEADRAKSEFISTVSHELRTPLTSIKGYVDLILLGSVGEISPMQRSFLEVVRSNSNRLVDLINDLLDISRIETGRIVLNPEPISILEVVEEVTESARAEIERKHLRLEVQVAPDLPPVQADRKRIVQVLNNLVSNAYKYTREGGRIAVVAGCTDGFVQISVADSGVGISKEDLKKLFTRFFRADNPLRDEVGGTGLGLAISKSFIELHGGQMWVESEVDVGSTFFFTLPLQEASAQQEEQPASNGMAELAGRPPTERKSRILVVDDEPNIVDLLRYQLERAGYEVYTARRGEEALQVARREHPDLITLDLLMAGMDGAEVLEKLKGDKQTADIPVVIISIVAEKENLMAMGAIDFLPKPLEEPELLATVERVLQQMQKPVGTVLVADDDPDIVGWLRRVLTEKGFAVREAGDGEAVLNLVVQSAPDLILLDLRMPKLDGREVITRLKLREDTRDIPIIVITASSVDREKDRVQILGMGAEGFLTKPFPAEDLVREIGLVLSKKTEAAKE